jgi:hypothetical protein
MASIDEAGCEPNEPGVRMHHVAASRPPTTSLRPQQLGRRCPQVEVPALLPRNIRSRHDRELKLRDEELAQEIRLVLAEPTLREVGDYLPCPAAVVVWLQNSSYHPYSEQR